MTRPGLSTILRRLTCRAGCVIATLALAGTPVRAQGNVVAILGCLAQVRAAAGSATDPTDRAILAVAVLFVDQIERRLGL